MPRGAKKRKAAKKKQENQSNNHSNPASASTHSHDVKQHDELKINSSDDGLKTNSSVEREFEFGAKSNGVRGGVDQDDEAAKSYNGRSSSYSSSGNSSDAEDREEKVDPPILEENEKKSSSESIVQSVEKKSPTMSDPVVFATQEAAESAFADDGTEQDKESAVLDFECEDVKQHDELKINSSDDGLKINSSVEREFEFGAKSNGVRGGVDQDDEAAKSYNGRSSSNSSREDREEKVDPPILEENEKKSSSEAIVQSVEKKTPTSNSSSGNSSDAEDREEKVEPPLLEENEKKSSSEGIVQSAEKKTPTISDPVVFATQEAAETAFADNGTEQDKESAVTEPLLVRSPCPEKKTSWKSCCGLFEVFSGSGR